MISLVGSETSAVRKNVRYFCFSVMMKTSIPQLNYKRTFIELLQLYRKPKNQSLYDVFRGYKTGTLALNGLTKKRRGL